MTYVHFRGFSCLKLSDMFGDVWSYSWDILGADESRYIQMIPDEQVGSSWIKDDKGRYIQLYIEN